MKHKSSALAPSIQTPLLQPHPSNPLAPFAPSSSTLDPAALLYTPLPKSLQPPRFVSHAATQFTVPGGVQGGGGGRGVGDGMTDLEMTALHNPPTPLKVSFSDSQAHLHYVVAEIMAKNGTARGAASSLAAVQKILDVKLKDKGIILGLNDTHRVGYKEPKNVKVVDIYPESGKRKGNTHGNHKEKQQMQPHPTFLMDDYASFLDGTLDSHPNQAHTHRSKRSHLDIEHHKRASKHKVQTSRAIRIGKMTHIPKQHALYESFRPLHALWCAYVQGLLQAQFAVNSIADLLNAHIPGQPQGKAKSKGKDQDQAQAQAPKVQGNKDEPMEMDRGHVYFPHHNNQLSVSIQSIPKPLQDKVGEIFYRLDYHGALIHVIESLDPTLVGIQGIVVVETANVFKIIDVANKVRTVAKRICVFAVQVPAVQDQQEVQIMQQEQQDQHSPHTQNHTDPIYVEFQGIDLKFRPSERAARKFKKSNVL